ncbi:MAG: phospho-N-acetylmuramoyl-pentapeptide-transferase [Lachnospiraceae bacterium]|nr:phospho-N-acetylmuramoyl-pentapeptide-transferase [Lachnospiraceae bacterium]
MIYFFTGQPQGSIAFIGILAAFILTCFTTSKFADLLPKDLGRDFAFDGKKSAGKPRGAGIIFILVFCIVSLVFGKVDLENSLYLLLVFAAMLTGFLDDASKAPWGEYKKGLLDLLIAAGVAGVYLYFNPSSITFAVFDFTLVIPPVVFAILTMILVWGSINVTNCSDGVDGLSGTLTIITIMTFYVIDIMRGTESNITYFILIFAVCILGYLWFNATPSKLLMGDAGSRAMGLFIAVAALKSGDPLLFIPAAFVLIMDGGLGLVKVFLLRFLKIRILKNVRTPLHDQARKVSGWSNTQTVFRFAIIQLVISMAVIYMVINRL